MTSTEKLLSLLQPKDYKSKIKLFCAEKQIKTENFVQRFGNIENKNYICRIKIKEL